MYSIDRVKREVSMNDLLDYYGFDYDIDKRGYQAVRCMFHDDSSPSASLNLDTEHFKCFVCGISGDQIDIVSEVEGISIGEAIEFLAQEFDVQ